MAVLSAADRAALRAIFSQDASSARTPLALSKADLLAAVDAVDTWVDSNASNFNQALPVAARTNLTAKQKAQLLMFVVRRRYEVA